MLLFFVFNKQTTMKFLDSYINKIITFYYIIENDASDFNEGFEFDGARVFERTLRILFEQRYRK